MDNEFSQLEAELKALRPVAPSRHVQVRIARELERGEVAARVTPSARAWWRWAAAVPAAAAVLILLVVFVRRVPPASPSENVAAAAAAAVSAAVVGEAESEAVFKPVSAENVLYAVADEGLVTLDDGTAARRERLSYVDTITWKNPRTNASVRWTMPREEVRVVPVKFQ
jgi:hypothetical protein